MIFVTYFCPQCQKRNMKKQEPPFDLSCTDCSYSQCVSLPFERCSLCSCRAFFCQKSFNPILGLGIVGVACLFVPYTKGLSLVVAAFIDALIYYFIPVITVCYRCHAGFYGEGIPQDYPPFQHHIAEKYEKERKNIE